MKKVAFSIAALVLLFPALAFAADKGLSFWQVVGQHGFELLGTVLVALIGGLVTVLGKKWNFESESAKVNDVVEKAIGFAEQWAKKKAKVEGVAAPGGPEKLATALDMAEKIAAQYKLK